MEQPGLRMVATQGTSPPMGPSSTQTVCTSCGSAVYTNASRQAKASAWLCCLLCCICGCLPCCCIPCFMDSFNVTNHTCPKCGAFLGQYRP